MDYSRFIISDKAYQDLSVARIMDCWILDDIICTGLGVW